ncbi:hypothetical protein VE25_18780, partial [Devosia geojensis]
PDPSPQGGGESGRLRLRRRSFLTGAASAAVLAPLPRAWARTQTRIEVAGNRLTYGGQPLRLVGIAVGDPYYIRAGRAASDYVVIARDWAANCVRISVHPGHWRIDPARMDQLLEADVAAARAEGLFVIIDWHAIGFPGGYQPAPPPEWGLPPDVYLSDIALARSFWRHIAGRYGQDPAILLEIWNEPVVDETLWDSTGEHWPVLRAAWEEIVAEIRMRSDNVVLCAGGRFAHDLVGVADNPVSDPRAAYAWHAYPNEDRHLPDRWLRSLDRLHETKPVVVTEWGFCPECSDGLQGSIEDFGRPFIETVLDGFGLGHTAWCYSPGAAPALLAADGATPSDYGAFVRAHLRRLAGRDTGG